MTEIYCIAYIRISKKGGVFRIDTLFTLKLYSKIMLECCDLVLCVFLVLGKKKSQRTVVSSATKGSREISETDNDSYFYMAIKFEWLLHGKYFNNVPHG